MKVYVDCLGCEQRKIEAQRIINYLKANHLELTDSPDNCDCAILITCAVNSSKEDYSLSEIKDLSTKLSHSTYFLIGGCLPFISPNKLRCFHINNTFSPTNLEALDSIFHASILMKEIEYPNKSIYDILSSNNYLLNEKVRTRGEYESAKRGFKIIINQGCLGTCSYCMIRKATGKVNSQQRDKIIRQAKLGISSGEKTIMLIGGDTGAYGIDIGTSLYILLEELISLSGNYKIFIHDFNIQWLIWDIEKYIRLFELDKDNRLRTICFPIQSGSDRVLGLMKRPYRSEDVISSLLSIRKINPSLKIGTHIMIGFPSETEEDFLLTLKLFKSIEFDFITCFPYSEHENAASFMIPNKVAYPIIENRMKIVSNFLHNKVKIIR